MLPVSSRSSLTTHSQHVFRDARSLSVGQPMPKQDACLKSPAGYPIVSKPGMREVSPSKQSPRLTASTSRGRPTPTQLLSATPTVSIVAGTPGVPPQFMRSPSPNGGRSSLPSSVSVPSLAIGHGSPAASVSMSTPAVMSRNSLRVQDWSLVNPQAGGSSQLKDSLDAINCLSAAWEQRFKDFEDRFQVVAGDVGTLSASLDQRLEQMERNAQVHVQEIWQQISNILTTTRRDAGEGTAVAVAPAPNLQAIEDRLQDFTGKFNTISALQDSVVRLNAQFQGEQLARRQLALQVATEMEKLKVLPSSSKWSTASSAASQDLEGLRAELEHSIRDHCYRNAEIVAQNATELAEAQQRNAEEAAAQSGKLEALIRAQQEKMEISIKSISIESPRSSVDKSAIDKLKRELDDEIRERCYRHTELVARMARELADVRTWSIEELGRLQAAWELTETTRHGLLKHEVMDICSGLQANVESLGQHMFSNT